MKCNIVGTRDPSLIGVIDLMFSNKISFEELIETTERQAYEHEQKIAEEEAEAEAREIEEWEKERDEEEQRKYEEGGEH